MTDTKQPRVWTIESGNAKTYYSVVDGPDTNGEIEVVPRNDYDSLASQLAELRERVGPDNETTWKQIAEHYERRYIATKEQARALRRTLKTALTELLDSDFDCASCSQRYDMDETDVVAFIREALQVKPKGESTALTAEDKEFRRKQQRVREEDERWRKSIEARRLKSASETKD